ncbi:MAG: endonuclease [Lentisphaerae bacterium]|nr:endonuclease [Lentisphaerota bacterium]
MTFNRYVQIVERVFRKRHTAGASEVPFRREDLVSAAKAAGVDLPKNVGDLLYTFRFRSQLPVSIQSTAPSGKRWTIELAGRGIYRFRLRPITEVEILPNRIMAETKVPDATPGVVSMYALSDEQALLAKLRYNRLLDIFTGVACYSLQNHLRTTAKQFGQVETDELYVGIDRRGVHYCIPLQAKSAKDRLNVVQIEQDMAMCAEKFPSLVCRPVGAQFIERDLIALFEFQGGPKGIRLSGEKHYRLAPPDQITPDDLAAYQKTLQGNG